MSYIFAFPNKLPSFKEQALTTQKLSRAVRQFLSADLQFNPQGKRFILGVSGGADSLALLCLWAWLKPVYEHQFVVAHVDHLLRKESTAEAKAVAALCEAWGIPYAIHTVNIAEKAKKHQEGIEERARKERYAFFATQMQTFKADAICLAHHIQDLQEDIFMRLIRGAAWPALGGMVAHDAERGILRPLLLQEPQALRHMLQGAGLSWAEDASNADTAYMRNRMRHTLLPIVHAENPSFSEKVKNVWSLAQCDHEHWQQIIQEICEEYYVKNIDGKVRLPAQLLKTKDKATRLRLYVHALRILRAHVENSHIHARTSTLLQLDTALMAGRGGTIFQLPGKVTAQIQKKSIVFSYTSEKAV